MSQSTLNAEIFEACSLADASGYIAMLSFLHEAAMNHPGWRTRILSRTPESQPTAFGIGRLANARHTARRLVGQGASMRLAPVYISLCERRR